MLGTVTAVAILCIIVVALAGLGNVVVGALAESAWGMFTVALSISPWNTTRPPSISW